MGETIIDEYGDEYWVVDDDQYWSEDQIEAALAQREYERELEFERYVDHLENLVDHAEKVKGRTLTERELTSFVRDYEQDGIEEAADTLHRFANLDDRDERRDYMAERMQESERNEREGAFDPAPEYEYADEDE